MADKWTDKTAAPEVKIVDQIKAVTDCVSKRPAADS